MLTIHKFPLHFYTTLELPETAVILSAQYQNERLYLWALLDTDAPTIKRTFDVVGTGQTMNHIPRKHVATVQHNTFVWHVFEELR